MAYDLPDPEAELPRMTLAEHLDELRRRVLISLLALVVAMLVSFLFWHDLWDFAKQPFLEAARLQGLPDAQLQALDPGEGFLAALKVCFLAAFVTASPIVLWQLWGFVSAGLYPHERRVVRIFFPISVVLFLLGVVFAYYVLVPFGLRWLIGWNANAMGIATQFRVETYLSTCLTMVFGMAIVSELPLVMLFLEATDLVRRETFRSYWRVAVVLAFVIGMILTDPSPVTQVAMALPLVGLYFLGIWGGAYVGPERRRFRWWQAWPVVLGLLGILLLLVYSREISAWGARLFGAGGKPPAEGPAQPGR
jgi:sec-independent protein translocase protein TatC